MYRILKALILFGLLLAAWNPCAAMETPELQTIPVLATAPIVSKDIPGARKEAIHRALRQSVNTALCGILPTDTLVLEFDRVNSLLRTDFQIFVKSHRVLSESGADGEYSILIHVDVHTGELRDVLKKSGILVEKSTLPRILILMGEQGIHDSSPLYAWVSPTGQSAGISSSHVLGHLTDRGFKPVSVSGGTPGGPDVFVSPPDRCPTPEEAAEMGRSTGADVVICGTVTVSPEGNTMGDLRSFSAQADAVATLAENGRVLSHIRRFSSTTDTRPDIGSRNALTEASARMAQDLAVEIASAWEKNRNQPRVIDMKVFGTDYLAKLVKLRQAVSRMEGVTTLRTVEMKADGALIRVHYKGTTADLAGSLMLATFSNFALNLSDVTENGFSVSFVAPAPSAPFQEKKP